MRNKFIKISRICLVLLFITLISLIIFSVTTQESETDIPLALFLFWVLSIFAAGVCILISVVIEAVESYKEKGLSFLIEYILTIAGVCLLYLVYNYFFGEQGLNLPESLVQPIIIVCAVRGSRVIVGKKEKGS